MKKIMVLGLAVAMSVSLVACGGQPAAPGEKETVEVQTTAEQKESTAAVEVETTQAVEETSSQTFDNSWASNEFELQIAEPSFDTWEVRGFTEGVSYHIFVQDVHYNTAKSYADSLRSYGFTLNEMENDGYNGLAYIFEADNAAGYRVELVFEAGSRDGMGSFSVDMLKAADAQN